MFAVRIQRPADVQHPLSTIGQREIEVAFEVKREASSAGAKLQQGRPA